MFQLPKAGCMSPGALVWFIWWSSSAKQSLGALATLRFSIEFRRDSLPVKTCKLNLTTDEESCCGVDSPLMIRYAPTADETQGGRPPGRGKFHQAIGSTGEVSCQALTFLKTLFPVLCSIQPLERNSGTKKSTTHQLAGNNCSSTLHLLCPGCSNPPDATARRWHGLHAKRDAGALWSGFA
jgi:hypothetical protein